MREQQFWSKYSSEVRVYVDVQVADQLSGFLIDQEIIWSYLLPKKERAAAEHILLWVNG